VRSPTGARPASIRSFGDPRSPRFLITGDHWLEVPLDHREPGRPGPDDRSGHRDHSDSGHCARSGSGRRAPGGVLRLYAREVRSALDPEADLPYLVFLQGGPGGRSPRPGTETPGWLEWALQRFRVILLDQRGTGRSGALDRHTLGLLGGGRDGARRQAEHLALFRADAIVADCEVLRRHLLGDVPWTVLGQSFGGFCTWTYLSQAPAGLAAALVTGGVPPVGIEADEVYRATSAALARRQGDLDAAHPQVREVLAGVARQLEHTPVYLPTGERLTPDRLREVGAVLGASAGPDRLAHLADDAWSVEGTVLSDTFLAEVASVVSYAGRPLYALVHEAIYAERGQVTGWSAHRVQHELGLQEAVVAGPDGVERLRLFGEMVFPHTVAADPALASLTDAAHLLAERSWTEPLYDPDQLSVNQVPVAACIYTQDMYVDPELSRRTVAATGSVTVLDDSLHHHDGLRRAGPEILDRLAEAMAELAPGALSEPRLGEQRDPAGAADLPVAVAP